MGKRDKSITAEIYRFVREFQNIEIRVTPENTADIVSVFVHPPYMLQSVTLVDNDEEFKKLKKRHRARLQKVKKARETTDRAVKEFLNRQFYESSGREKSVASGRAEIEEIRKLLQEAVDQGLIPTSRGAKYPDGHDMREWLKKYGIGIDCSGFVQQALKRLIEVGYTEVGHISIRRAKPDIRFLRCLWVYRNITANTENGEQIFEEVSTPAQARPGDILVNRNHMRIVANIDVVEDDGIIFELVESTSASDIPSGQTREDSDVGPRIIHVKYMKPNQPISKQTPLRKRWYEGIFKEDKAESSYVIGRSRELDQLWVDT